MYAEGFKPSPKGLPCTHKSSDLASTGFDPPQTPLKKGGARLKSPFFKGDLGGSRSTLIPCPRCVYTVAQRERDFESFSGSPRSLGEGLGVRAKTTVLNMDLV